jgi:hypothetical protein
MLARLKARAIEPKSKRNMLVKGLQLETGVKV